MTRPVVRGAKLLLSASVMLLPLRAHADPYKNLANRLGQMGARHLSAAEKKVAVLPFNYVDGRTSPGGSIVSENLINFFVETGDYSVIDRSQVEKLLGELKFQRTGVVDAATAKEIGRGLGVPAIVTGTMQSLPGGAVQINARMIKTETFEIIGSARQEVDKTWSDQPGAEPEPAQPAYGGGATMATMAYGKRGGGGGGAGGGFMDLFYGFGGGSADMSFANFKTGQVITGGELGFPGMTPNSFTSITFANLDTAESNPFGIRFGGFGPWVGLGVEGSWFSTSLKSKAVTPTVVSSSGTRASAVNVPDGYLKVDVLTLPAMDLLLKIPVSKSFFPYGGVGAGLTINKAESALITTWTESQQWNSVTRQYDTILTPAGTLNETALGYAIRYMGGLRAYIGDVGLFAEYRVVKDKFTFDRGIGINEKDNVTLNTSALAVGLTFKFGR